MGVYPGVGAYPGYNGSTLSNTEQNVDSLIMLESTMHWTERKARTVGLRRDPV